MSQEQELIEELLFLNEILRGVTDQQLRIQAVRSICMVLFKRKKKVLGMLGGDFG